MTRAECGHVTVSPAVLALLADAARLRRLRVAYRPDPVIYPELLQVSAIVLGAPERTSVAISFTSGDADHMTSTEFAVAAGLSPRAVQRACREGRLSAVKRAGVWLIPVAELARRAAA
jgi:hypothetical protein